MFIKKFNSKLIKNLIFFIIFIVVIQFFNHKKNIYSKTEFIISYIKMKKEFKRNKKYFNFINNKLFIIKKYKKIKKPKVSVISPIYNREKYILKFLKNIQSQTFNDIEIIFIDDASKDNTIKLIEELQNIDERIKLIKNNFNKGTFISRNLGALYSNSKYVILPDPDDILNKNITLNTKLIIHNQYSILKI